MSRVAADDDLSDDPLKDVADRTAAKIADAMSSGDAVSEVVDLFHGKGRQ